MPPNDRSSKVGGKSAATIMIKNGLYLITTKMLDGADVVNNHVMVLRDGTMRGGGAFFYTFGSYTCSGGKWKGEATTQEHTPTFAARTWAGKVVSIGFTGTYTNDGAELDAAALVSSRSTRIKSILRLLIAD